jgi:hypothetical protein
MIAYVKKWLMKQQWRFQYSSTWYSLVMGALNTGALWTIYFKDFFPIPASILVPGISVFYIAGFLFVGWFLDEKLKLWKEGSEVTAERNPYTIDQPYFKEIEWGGRLTRAAWLAWFRYFTEKGIDQKEFVKELQKYIDWQDKWGKSLGIKGMCDMSEIYGDKQNNISK